MNKDKDKLQRFMFESHAIRGEIIHMDTSYKAISERHPYPLMIRKLLGETLAAAALLSATLKYKGLLTLQAEGNGPLKLLVAQCNNILEVRGLAQWEEGITEDSFSHLLNKGQLVMTIAPENGKRYQSIVSLSQGDLAASLATYFEQSEQLKTYICLFADKDQVAGIFLQAMPNSIKDDPNAWHEIVELTKTLTQDEIFTLATDTLLHRLYANETIRLFESQPVKFHCSCTVTRMEKAILMVEREEVEEILRLQKWLTVTCEFCNHSYNFDANEVLQLYQQAETNEVQQSC